MRKFLLLDFGASRVKTGVCNLETGKISQIRDHPPVPNSSRKEKEFLISLKLLKNQFLSICHRYYESRGTRFDGIVLCSQMHGFAVLDTKNRPLTEYVSWKDERSLFKIKGVDTFALITKELGNSFGKVTGMKARPGLPYTNAIHLARKGEIRGECKIISLPEWLALSSGESKGVTHPTMAAGLGFYDIHKKEYSAELLSFANKATGVRFVLNPLGADNAISGYWWHKTVKIPIFVGVGDLPCAVLGAGNIPNRSVSINIGTGSQVSVIDLETSPKGVEFRPYFGDSCLTAITHIPAGRALAEYLSFLEDICRRITNKKVDFWQMLARIDEERILNASLDFDLAIFKSAWDYKSGGRISGVSEGNLNLNNYLASLLKSFVMQYVGVVDRIDRSRRLRFFILSGGIPRRLKNLRGVFSQLFLGKVRPPAEIDETLLGLMTLALMASGRFQKYYDAQNFFKKN